MKKRIIACLDIDNGKVIKGQQFKSLTSKGDPVEFAYNYYKDGADELILLDVAATYHSRIIVKKLVETIAKEVFIPLCVGGGIGSVEDIKQILRSGADKISLCSAALYNPMIVNDASKKFGSQCVVISIDTKKVGKFYKAFSVGGRINTDCNTLDWALQVERLGAGEILLNSIDNDGMQNGFDLQLTKMIGNALSIPVIASGGAKDPKSVYDVFVSGNADAALCASILHDKVTTIKKIKNYLKSKGVEVR